MATRRNVTILVVIALMAVFVSILIFPQRDDPDKPPKHLSSLELADAFLSKGEYAKAIEELSRAAQTEPDNAEVFYSLGLAYLGNDQHTEAATNFTQAITLNPEHARSYAQRALVHNHQREYEKALADSNAALQLDP